MILHRSENHLISSVVIRLYYPAMDIYYCLKIMVFQDVTPFSLVDVYQQFGWTCCLHIMVSVRRVGAKLHSITLHKTTVFIFTTQRTLDHVWPFPNMVLSNNDIVPLYPSYIIHVVHTCRQVVPCVFDYEYHGLTWKNLIESCMLFFLGSVEWETL
jgi:hypothetical protein